MPRKFTLCHKKKHYPSSTSLLVSVPLSTVCLSGGQDQDDCMLPISLHISMYTGGDVESLERLEDRSVLSRRLTTWYVQTIDSSYNRQFTWYIHSTCRLD